MTAKKTGSPVRVIRRPRRSNSGTFIPRQLAAANLVHEETRRERLQRRARVLVDHDAAAREAHFFLMSMALLASAVPETMTREEILDASSRVSTARRSVIALKSDVRDTTRQILNSGWEHAVLRLPRHKGVTRHDLGLIRGWSWHGPDMPCIGKDGISRDLLKLMGGEIEDFLRFREAVRRLDGRQSKHTQEALIEEIVALRESDPDFLRRLEAVEARRGKGHFAVQRWQLTAGGDDELAATFDRQTIRKSRDRRGKLPAAWIFSKEFCEWRPWPEVPSVKLAQEYLLWRDWKSLNGTKPPVAQCRSLTNEQKASAEIRPANKGSVALIKGKKVSLILRRGLERGVFDRTRAWGTARFNVLSLGEEADKEPSEDADTLRREVGHKVIDTEDKPRPILAQEDSCPWGQENPWEDDAEH